MAARRDSEALEKRIRAVYDAFDIRNYKVRQAAPVCHPRSLGSSSNLHCLPRALPPCHHQGAIKLANAGIQKYPDCHVFRSLKAVALERTGKLDEALQVGASLRWHCSKQPACCCSCCLRQARCAVATPHAPATRLQSRCAAQAVQQVLAAAPPDDHVLNMLLLVLKPANRTADLLPAYEAAFAKAPHNEELAAGLFACHVRCAALPAGCCGPALRQGADAAERVARACCCVRLRMQVVQLPGAAAAGDAAEQAAPE